ncbi:hypothetical protein PCC7811_01638 [Planktothrix agardhii]|jgi:hypothetical protein|uniref:Uncharacterized protein n=1 Tax=Planktothrix agardhii TaxID=1160 RepID=A0AAD1V4Z7_PLAAG|nr:hypothetical protein PANO66_01192 [Planktothrix agardhii]CAD5933218.1 hypothetical protein NO2A_01878 [Planktothrix agardhii]CAD5936381.1 hypothetical protein PCC7811_01638 [Planktothrix agardhii]CAD5943641.1 hypothetical protein PCC7821_02072 [Planktothrix rubescens NIVA-CYA 18]
MLEDLKKVESDTDRTNTRKEGRGKVVWVSGVCHSWEVGEGGKNYELFLQTEGNIFTG